MIDDLEHEIDRNYDDLQKVKKTLEHKEKDVQNLEKCVLEKVDEIEILNDNNISMINQISENVNMEKRIEV